jgi:hypothetical protein
MAILFESRVYVAEKILTYASDCNVSLLPVTMNDVVNAYAAICVVVPYTSNDPEKAIANGAMLFEWVRYYGQLGIKTIVYDRDGANRQYIYDSVYGYAHTRNDKKVFEHLVYHGYTVRGLLDPSRKGELTLPQSATSV